MRHDDRYRRAAAAGGVGVWDWNLETNEIYVDPILKELLGYEDHEIRNHLDDWGRLVHPDDAAAVLDRARAHIAGDTPVYEVEHRMLHRDGSVRWFLARGSVMRDASGRAVSMAGSDTDVTERRREEAFRAAQHRMLEKIASGSALPDVLDSLVRLVEQQSDGMLCSVLLLDEDGLHARHAAAPSLPADYVRAIDGAMIGPRHGSCGTAMYLRKPVFVGDILVDPLWDDYRELARTFGLRACWSTPIFSPQQRVLGSLAMYYSEPRTPRDGELRLIETAAHLAGIAIEQQRAQQALRHSEARNRAILRAIPDWMFLTTVDGLFVDYHASDESGLYTPPAQFLGKHVRDVLPAPLSDDLMRAFARVNARDETEKLEYTLGSGDGEQFFEASIVAFGDDMVLSIVRDVTNRKRAELEAAEQRRELAHLSRVAMLGELTGALAHELSQPLTAVLNNALAARYLLQREAPDLAELKEAIEGVIDDNKRAAAVMERLRALLRKESSPPEAVDLSDLVRDVLELAHSEIVSRRICVATQLPSGMPAVLGDRVQLQQVVLNLLLNACDAMSAIPISQRRVAISTEPDGSAVQLVVSDCGVGIPSGELERVFEPFVTFREAGLGLGLAITRSIVIAHRGSIRAENNVQGGATFRCWLPVA